MGLLRHTMDSATREQTRLALFEYIEAFYNRQRRHSTLGYVCQSDVEDCHRGRRYHSQPCTSASALLASLHPPRLIRVRTFGLLHLLAHLEHRWRQRLGHSILAAAKERARAPSWRRGVPEPGTDRGPSIGRRTAQLARWMPRCT